MTQAKSGDVVKVHYTGKLNDGQVFDSTQGREPLEVTLGSGQLIKGFEDAVLGMAPGESKTADVPAGEAYGPHRNEMVVKFDREQVPDDLNPQVGQQLQLQREDGQPLPVVVVGVDQSSVTVDANHPLAGKDLTFDLQLVEIV